VQVCSSPEEVREIAGKMLGQVLVTHQTGPEGRLVNKLFVAEAAEIARELYLAVLLDRASSAPVVIASTEGGMDIETVAEHTPEKLFREPVHPLLGWRKSWGWRGTRRNRRGNCCSRSTSCSSRRIARWWR
jgi:succinyl-CoA synthetase beta subunit